MATAKPASVDEADDTCSAVEPRPTNLLINDIVESGSEQSYVSSHQAPKVLHRSSRSPVSSRKFYVPPPQRPQAALEQSHSLVVDSMSSNDCNPFLKLPTNHDKNDEPDTGTN